MQYCTIDDLEVGDIAVYNHPTLKIMITHRVIEKNVVEGDSENTYVITKGDANSSDDGLAVTNDMVVGKLVAVYNWMVPVMNLIMRDGGKVDNMALILLIICVSIIVTVVTSLVYLLVMMLVSVCLANSKNSQLDRCIESFENNIKAQDGMIEDIKSLHISKDDSMRQKIGKVIMISRLKSFEGAVDDLKKTKKSVKKYSGWPID
jgi:signal peptidase I